MNLWNRITETHEIHGQNYWTFRPWFVLFTIACWIIGGALVLTAFK